MIEKIIEISNIGHFVDFRLHGSLKWNGVFRQLNIIYAPNGSGKTTLSTILKSLATNDAELVKFKRTFGSDNDPKVLIKEKNNRNLVKLNSSSWTSHNLSIEVFDINYIEEYLFAGSYSRKQNKTNLFKLLLGDEGVRYRAKMKPFIHVVNGLTDRRRKKDIYKSISSKDASLELKVLIKEYQRYSAPIFQEHIETVNKYLWKFTHYIKLVEFSYASTNDPFQMFKIFPVFEVYGERVIFSAPDPAKKIGNARYSMSEGDKSTIALCFFLARLEIQGTKNRIIVFDDPLSSFDYSRRNSTIHQLAKIAKEATQFILLTHDLAFANDFADKCSFLDLITLKIENNGETSYIAYHDISAEFLTTTQKDIQVIKNYLKSGVNNDEGKREVVRCIRPVLEGVLKTKFFDIIRNDVWLGDIIELIKKSPKADRLFRLNDIVDEITELNDYTKMFHHSSGDIRDTHVNAEELKRYIDTLMTIIDKI